MPRLTEFIFDQLLRSLWRACYRRDTLSLSDFPVLSSYESKKFPIKP